ncbi:hypothetical protein CRE_11399 [Caenorhabditis remanei]|uniref:DUF19 domain-containing protein n=1 Tax=Caenorhabditis remanei TaxID=31234 RepID=E3N736_CAERE|nr:hypothetical protein CRE_11399 [Caenorhabditis remanei]
MVKIVKALKKGDYYNIDLIRKGLGASKNISDCLGDNLQCHFPKYMAFVVNTQRYAREILYGDTFPCFFDANGYEVAVNCIEYLSFTDDTLINLWNNPSTLQEAKNEILECIFKEFYGRPSSPIRRIF